MQLVQNHGQSNQCGVMTRGNIVARAGIKPISLAFLASVLTITLAKLPDVTHNYLSMWFLAKKSVYTTTMKYCQNSREIIKQNKQI